MRIFTPDMFVRCFQFAKYGALFKSSTIQPLTEKESEYVVSVQKHVFKKHVVLQVGGGAIRLFIFFFLLSIFFFLLQPRAPSSSPSPHTRSSLSKTPSRSSSFAMSPSTSTPPLSKLTARLPPLPSNAIFHACSAAPAPCPLLQRSRRRPRVLPSPSSPVLQAAGTVSCPTVAFGTPGICFVALQYSGEEVPVGSSAATLRFDLVEDGVVSATDDE